MPFRDRADAGRQLARALLGMKLSDPVVLALPRGGVPVAAEIARRLSVPLELVLVGKICVPDEPELAMGAVAEGITPVAARDILAVLESEADDIVCLHTCERFHSVRVYYDDYPQVTDQEVLEALRPLRGTTEGGRTNARTAANQQPGEQT